MYITYDKETKRVAYIGEKTPLVQSENLECVEVAALPEKYHYLTFEDGALVAHFVEQTAEQIEAQKQAKYEAKVDNLVREKYSLSNELAILRQRDTKPEEFAEYNTYVEECKVQAKRLISEVNVI